MYLPDTHFLCAGGGGHRGKCDDGTKPTCSDGSAPVRTKPHCPDGGRPTTCADGSTPTRGNGGGRGGCAKAVRVCCDGSAPVFDGDKSTPPCASGRPVCDVATQC